MTLFYPGSVGCGLSSEVALLSPRVASWASSLSSKCPASFSGGLFAVALGKPCAGGVEFL